MPKHSYGVEILSGDLLAVAVEALIPSHPHLRPIQETLKEALAEMRSAKDIQLTYRAAAQQATRDLEEATEKAKEASVRLHDGIRSILGIQNPQLLGFGMRPHRSARRGRFSAARDERSAHTASGGGIVPPA